MYLLTIARSIRLWSPELPSNPRAKLSAFDNVVPPSTARLHFGNLIPMKDWIDIEAIVKEELNVSR